MIMANEYGWAKGWIVWLNGQHYCFYFYSLVYFTLLGFHFSFKFCFVLLGKLHGRKADPDDQKMGGNRMHNVKFTKNRYKFKEKSMNTCHISTLFSLNQISKSLVHNVPFWKISGPEGCPMFLLSPTFRAIWTQWFLSYPQSQKQQDLTWMDHWFFSPPFVHLRLLLTMQYSPILILDYLEFN